MTWYCTLVWIIGYLAVGSLISLLCKMSSGISDFLDLDDNPIALAAVACLWPIVVVCIVFYIPLFGLGRFIEWLDNKLRNGKV